MCVIIVIGAYVVMVLSNVFSQRKLFGGKDNKTISDEHPSFVSPDGKTFAIWGFIYLLETLLVIAQAVPSEHTEELFGQQCPITGLDVRARLALAFLSNAFWLPVFSNEWFWGALAIMAVYLGFLVSVYKDLNVTTTGSILQYLTFAAGIAMNTSWIVVAFLVSMIFCAGEAGWKDERGVAGSVPVACVAVVFVALLGCERAVRACDLAWAFVAAWALQGIFRMQSIPDRVRFPIGSMNAKLASCAYWCSILVAVAMVAGAVLELSRTGLLQKAY